MEKTYREVKIYNKWFPNEDYSQANILNAIKEALQFKDERQKTDEQIELDLYKRQRIVLEKNEIPERQKEGDDWVKNQNAMYNTESGEQEPEAARHHQGPDALKFLNCLRDLVRLKEVKETEGATEAYELERPAVWATAKKLVHQFKYFGVTASAIVEHHQSPVAETDEIRKEIAVDFFCECRMDVQKNGYQEVRKMFDNWFKDNKYFQNKLFPVSAEHPSSPVRDAGNRSEIEIKNEDILMLKQTVSAKIQEIERLKKWDITMKEDFEKNLTSFLIWTLENDYNQYQKNSWRKKNGLVKYTTEQLYKLFLSRDH